jgi:hypothetical protein
VVSARSQRHRRPYSRHTRRHGCQERVHAAASAAFLFVAALAGAAPAQTGPAGGKAALPGDVVVTGMRDKLSGWREAETSHVVIASDGPAADLARLARNLERLHFLLSGLFGRAGAPNDKIKLRITLIGDTAAFQAMDLRNTRWQQPAAGATPADTAALQQALLGDFATVGA